MKEMVVLSGKGGTGKTSVTAALASLERPLVLCDADVDAPDLHLLANPTPLHEEDFEGAWQARIDPDRCDPCGMCQDLCQFDAISINARGYPEVRPFLCEGCRLCERHCPKQAITSERSRNNHWMLSETRFGPMLHARMGPGEENSGKLVTKVRTEARQVAEKGAFDFILTDGPPGTGCPTIAAMSGCDEVLLVIEPSQSGIHDASRVIDLAEKFQLPVQAIINKADLHVESCRIIRELLSVKNIPLLAEIPFSKEFVNAMISRQSVCEMAGPSKVQDTLKALRGSLFRSN